MSRGGGRACDLARAKYALQRTSQLPDSGWDCRVLSCPHSSKTLSRGRCRACDAARAKYVLQHTVRTHMACEDAAYQCMGAGQDAQGFPGVFLRKNVIGTASRALAENLRELAPLITPPYARVRPLLSTTQ